MLAQSRKREMRYFWNHVKYVVKHLTVSRIALYILLAGMVVFMMLPLWYMLVTAFKPLDELFIFPPRFYVSNPTTTNFLQLFKAVDTASVPFSRTIFNSLFTSLAAVLGTVFVSTAGAFAVSKLRLPGTGIIFAIITAALMFGNYVVQIPAYMIVNNLNMLDTYWALIIPKIAVAYNLFLIKQFCDQIPDALIEAATIDGAKEYRIYASIIMPMLKPAVATIVVQSFIANWNDYFSPLIFISNQAMKTLPLQLQLIASSGNIARAGAMAAATLLTTVPTILIFTVMQSRIQETMAHSGIKG